MRMDGPDSSLAKEALIAFINPSTSIATAPGEEARLALGDFDALKPVLNVGATEQKVPPGGAQLYYATRSPPIREFRSDDKASVVTATVAPRIVIENVAPSVAAGRFPARRIVGDRVNIEADIFTDGHALLAAELAWRAEDEAYWHHERMILRDNDRWQAAFDLGRIGRYQFRVLAWLDVYGGFVRDFRRKREAGQDITLDLGEGADLLRSGRENASGTIRAALDRILEAFDDLSADDRAQLLTAPETLETFRRAAQRNFLAESDTYAVDAERTRAQFASWYEFSRARKRKMLHATGLCATS